MRERLLDHFRRNPCVDCGETDVRTLEFDHVDEKLWTISHLRERGVPLDVLEAEIRRCEVVCANCHRRRTATRAGWTRLSNAPVAFPRPRRQRNVRWVYEHLQSCACADCGAKDPLILEFDHVGEKRASVMDMAWDEYALETIAAEIAVCEVRCCNCHRRRTADTRGYFRARSLPSP